ncbi:uracil-DNA glycosylase, partial [Escherichia coli]
IISLITQHREGVVFLLWGSHAQKKGAIIDKQRHHVLKATHPSPLSTHRGFFVCTHFLLPNQCLAHRGQTQLDGLQVFTNGRE